MLECPYCHHTLTESSASCPQCQLEFQAAKAVMGPVPRLSSEGVTDLADCLSRGDLRRLVRMVGAFRDRFPQCHLAVVFRSFSSDFPLGAQLFWLFNAGGLSSENEKGGRNRNILIGIDPKAENAGLTMGYGLEPFLNQTALDHILALAGPYLQVHAYLEAARELIKGLIRLLEGVCRELGELVGTDLQLMRQGF